MTNRGFLMIEILISAAIIASALVALTGVIYKLSYLSGDNLRRAQAGFLATEGAEVMRLRRDNGWNANIANLTIGQNYYLLWQSGQWQATTTPAKVDNLFIREIVVNSAYRDANGDLTAAGTADNNARRITVTVSWLNSTGATSSRSLQIYLTNLFAD